MSMPGSGFSKSGEVEDLTWNHVQYFIDLAMKAKYPIHGGPDQLKWLSRLEADHENFRVGFERAQQQEDTETGLRLVSALYKFFEVNDHFDQWMKWNEWALKRIAEAPLDLKGAIFTSVGLSSYCHDDRENAKKFLKKALAIYIQLGSPHDIGWAYRNMMLPSNLIPDDREEYLEYFKKSMDIFRVIDDQVGIASAYTMLGIHESVESNFEKSHLAHSEALKIARETGDILRESICLLNIGCNLMDEGKPELALEVKLESLRLSLGLDILTSFSLSTIASLAGPLTALGQAGKAVVLLGAVDRIFDKWGIFLLPEQEYDVSRYHSSARDKLDCDIYKQAWVRGQNMTYEEVVAYALEENDR